MIIVDTDVVIDILRQHPPAVAWISNIEDGVYLPGFVALELYQGCHNKSEADLLRKQIAVFVILWPDEAAATTAIQIYATAKLTHAIGILDVLIGATAKNYHVPLQSFNGKHFAGFPGLQVVQPYVR